MATTMAFPPTTNPAIPPTFTLNYSPKHKLDIYVPSTLPSPSNGFPTIVFFHGGGLLIGSREQNFIFPLWLLEATLKEGWAFVSVDYSKLPEFTAHDMITDVKDIFTFLPSSEITAKGIHLDTTRVAVVGASSGAYLGRLAFVHANSPARAFVSLYGMGGRLLLPHWTDIRKETGSLLPAGHPLIKLFNEGSYIDLLTGEKGLAEKIRNIELSQRTSHIPEQHKKLFPELFTSTFPPTLLLHGASDTVVPDEESKHTADQLKSQGKVVELIIVEGQEHGMGKLTPEVTQARNDVIVFLRKYLA